MAGGWAKESWVTDGHKGMGLPTFFYGVLCEALGEGPAPPLFPFEAVPLRSGSVKIQLSLCLI